MGSGLDAAARTFARLALQAFGDDRMIATGAIPLRSMAPRNLSTG